MSARESLKILLSSGSGKAGAVFLLALLLISAIVVVRFPLDFGSQRWNNPTEWADNPKSVAPDWIMLPETLAMFCTVSFGVIQNQEILVQ